VANRVCPFCANPVVSVMTAGRIRMWLHQEAMVIGGVTVVDRWIHSTEV
jgi:hypothetical protein